MRWNGVVTLAAQLVSPVAPVAMNVRAIPAAHPLQKVVSCPALATSTRWPCRNSGSAAFATSSGTTSRSELRISAGLENGWFAGNGGLGWTGVGHGTHQSAGKPPGTPLGRRSFAARQAAAENGANAPAGSAPRAGASWWPGAARGAETSQLERLSLQEVRTEGASE